MHWTGHTSTHARSLTSMHASVMIAIPATGASSGQCRVPFRSSRFTSERQILLCAMIAHGEERSIELLVNELDPGPLDARRVGGRFPPSFVQLSGDVSAD